MKIYLAKSAAAKFSLVLIICFAARLAIAEDITTLDSQTYTDVRDIAVKPGGLFFVVGDGPAMRGVLVALTNLPPEVKEKYHCDPYDLAMMVPRQNQIVYLNKNLAFSLNDLEAAKKKAREERKLIGFILEWDEFFIPSRPMGPGSNGALAHFYDVFHDNLVLVFVRHESELDQVPDAVKQGFSGPEEGGYAPNMAVVTADCSKFVCEIPYAAKKFGEREQIFRQKIEVIRKFIAANGNN